MTFGISLAIEGSLRGYMESRAAIAAGGMRKAAGLAGREVAQKWRGAIVGGGLSQRLANTIRAEVYPRAGVKTLEPSAFIYTKAPKIIRAFAWGATIQRSSEGVFLWIPTENVPRRGRRLMTPLQVEEAYGDFEYVPSITRPGVYLATVPAVRTQTRRGYRKANEKVLARGRNVVRIVMFILVRQVRLQKKFDFDAIEREAQTAWPEIVARSLAEAFRNDPEP